MIEKTTAEAGYDNDRNIEVNRYFYLGVRRRHTEVTASRRTSTEILRTLKSFILYQLLAVVNIIYKHMCIRTHKNYIMYN
jgi:hypothetical protein